MCTHVYKYQMLMTIIIWIPPRTRAKARIWGQVVYLDRTRSCTEVDMEENRQEIKDTFHKGDWILSPQSTLKNDAKHTSQYYPSPKAPAHISHWSELPLLEGEFTGTSIGSVRGKVGSGSPRADPWQTCRSWLWELKLACMAMVK